MSREKKSLTTVVTLPPLASPAPRSPALVAEVSSASPGGALEHVEAHVEVDAETIEAGGVAEADRVANEAEATARDLTDRARWREDALQRATAALAGLPPGSFVTAAVTLVAAAVALPSDYFVNYMIVRPLLGLSEGAATAVAAGATAAMVALSVVFQRVLGRALHASRSAAARVVAYSLAAALYLSVGAAALVVIDTGARAREASSKLLDPSSSAEFTEEDEALINRFLISISIFVAAGGAFLAAVGETEAKAAWAQSAARRKVRRLERELEAAREAGRHTGQEARRLREGLPASRENAERAGRAFLSEMRARMALALEPPAEAPLTTSELVERLLADARAGAVVIPAPKRLTNGTSAGHS